MDMLAGKRVDDFDEAAIAALHDAGRDDMALDIARLFTSTLDLDKLRSEAEKSINASVHARYGTKTRRSGQWWFVPVPEPSYESSPVPRISFVIPAYLVAVLSIQMPDWSSRSATIMGLLKRREKLFLPISFLQTILDDDLGQFDVASRDGSHTGWSIPGLREPLRLPNEFVAQLSRMLVGSVLAWLLDFGSEGMTVMPEVVGSLLGLQSHGVIAPVPVGQQPYRREVVIADLTRLFGSAQAAVMFEHQAPHLKTTMTNDEATTFIIKAEGGSRWNLNLP